MAEVQPSLSSPSPPPPPRAAGGDPEAPPLAPPMEQQQQQREGGGDRSEDQEDPPSPPLPQSTTVPISNAAQYIPRVTNQTTSTGGDARSWYSWNGGRTKDRRRPTPPPAQGQYQPQQPYPPPRQQPQQPYPPPRQQPQQWVTQEPKHRPQLPHVPDSPPVPPALAAPSTVPAPAPSRSVERDRRAVPDIMYRKRRTAALQRAALLARLVAAALCLAALAVLAADTRKGWALDSYSNYTQLRYSEAVNVIGFLYSVFQFFALALHLTRKKHLIPRPKGDYFDFTMDQVLAYLLISSSSSATARVSDWIDNWGSDTFPNMANSSIIISFLAFVVFAINSLISAYNLFRRDI